MNLESILLEWKSDDKIAVIEKNKEWSYSEFISHVLFVKEYLINNQIKKILICLPQSFYSYVFIWGAYLAGTTFCPVSLSIPDDRKKYFISLFKPELIIIDDNNLNINNVKYISPERFFNDKCSYPLNHNKQIDIESVAYIIFTSGSSGLPKGVMVSRKGLENFLKWSTAEFKIQPGDRWGQYSSLGFDLSICDIFTSISCGATLIPFSSSTEKFFPGKIINDKNVTFWHSVPSVIDIMNKAGHINSKMLSSLKTMTFCGERLFPSHLELLFEANPNLVIYNTYGPTEVTIFCTFLKLTKNNYRQFCNKTVCIGKVLPGYEMTFGNIKEGLGEIIILGEYIAKGYLASTNEFNEELNDGFKIITHNGKDENAYYTGDYAETKEGNTFYVCRKDSQIKVMGFRVDLTEIDYQLRMFGCKANITTFVNNKIVSFVICDNFSNQKIMDYLKRMLPPYYLPTFILEKDSFPYNSNGKIDLHELVNSLTI